MTQDNKRCSECGRLADPQTKTDLCLACENNLENLDDDWVDNDCENCQGTGDQMEGDVIMGNCLVCGGSGVND